VRQLNIQFGQTNFDDIGHFLKDLHADQHFGIRHPIPLITCQRRTEIPCPFSGELQSKRDSMTKDDYLRQGSNLLDQSRFQEALAAFEQALVLDGHCAHAWSLKGASLWRLGRCDGALQAYDQAVAHDPNNAEHWSNRGVVLNKLVFPCK
jgi:tetratricopeptide (TPR) repeat protein